MVNTTIKSVAMAAAFVCSASVVSAATESLSGTTFIELDEGFLPLLSSVGGSFDGLTPETLVDVVIDEDANLIGGTLAFEITGGHFENPVSIEHEGSSLTLTNGSAFATISDFIIRSSDDRDDGNGGVFGKLNGGAEIALFDFSDFLSDTSAELKISDTFADVLIPFFSTNREFGGVDFGIATVKPDVSEVPLPAAGWMLVGALAGLGAMRRKRGA